MRGDTMCNGGYTNDAAGQAARSRQERYGSLYPGAKSNSVAFFTGIPGVGAAAERQLQSKQLKEDTPPPKQQSAPTSSNNSGLSIRRSSRGKEKTPQRVKRSAAGARKRFKTK
jgi:hypothetical protein